MVTKDVQAVVLAGGSGTRLWPLSRLSLPKQFLSLHSDETLLEATISRLSPIISAQQVTIVTGSSAATGEAAVHLSPYRKIIEPAPRNTAAGIGVAALSFELAGTDPVMVVLPADHIIRKVPEFQKCLTSAILAAEAGKLVSFGILPDRPETGFGYIKAAVSVSTPSLSTPSELASVAAVTAENRLLRVESFTEKPDLATAKRFLAEGGYFWNSGMFVWRASAIRRAIRETLPALDATLEGIRAAIGAGATFEAALAAHFAEAPAISIDHGVLEKTAELHMLPADIGWSDVGSWDAVYDIADKDDAGNASQGNVVSVASRNTLVRGNKRLIAAVGVEDLAIVDTPDALLVTKRGESQKVKDIVDALAKRGASEHLEHVTVRRPWGTYTVLEQGPGFKIKRIEVDPGGRLSLQSHQHRSEHWVVVSGTATVTNDNQVISLNANESTFIPICIKHRLENNGTTPAQIIEVQVGKYLGEDDIQRYEDAYNRTIVTSEFPSN